MFIILLIVIIISLFLIIIIIINLVFPSRLNANEMLIFLNDLLYLRHGKAQKLKSLTAFVLRV